MHVGCTLKEARWAPSPSVKRTRRPIELYYEDHGSGPPVVLLHGWPLDSRSWEPQLHPLLEAGHRVILYDRRGFGRSSRPTGGYDFDTLAADLHQVLTEPRPARRDRDRLLARHRRAGALRRHLRHRAAEALRVHREPRAVVRQVRREPRGRRPGRRRRRPAGDPRRPLQVADRPAPATSSTSTTTSARGSARTPCARSGTPASEASPIATWACPPGWLDDFSEDIKRIDVPTLILHGTADRILPIDGQGRRLHAALPDARYVEIDGGPHVMCVTPRRRGQPRTAELPARARAGRAAAYLRRRRSPWPSRSRIALEPSAQGIVDATSNAAVPLRTRARRGAQGARGPAVRRRSTSSPSTRSGSPSPPPSATPACASSNPPAAPGRCP